MVYNISACIVEKRHLFSAQLNELSAQGMNMLYIQNDESVVRYAWFDVYMNTRILLTSD